MTRRDSRRVRTLRLAVIFALGTGALAAVAGPSTADVTAVTGSAYGASGSVSLFGGPPIVLEPVPTVSLPATGGNVTDSEPSAIFQAGPAVLFESGTLNVSTQGTTGPSGSVTSTATVTGVPDGPGPFLYQGVESSCTASESGVTGSTTITGGVLQTATDPNTGAPTASEDLPVNPPANFERTGTINHVGDSFRIVFNEQVTNPDGSLTVNGAHMYLLGPTAVGELIIAQSVCGVTATQTPTTQPGVTTTTQPGVTTTTQPGNTTTTQPRATTTTRPGGTTTTVVAVTTTRPGGGDPGTTTPPGSGPLVRTGSAPESLVVLGLLTLVLGALVLVGLSTRTAPAGGPWAQLVRRTSRWQRARRPWHKHRRR